MLARSLDVPLVAFVRQIQAILHRAQQPPSTDSFHGTHFALHVTDLNKSFGNGAACVACVAAVLRWREKAAAVWM